MIESIDRVNRVGIDRFRCEIDVGEDKLEIVYRLFACLAGARFELRAEPETPLGNRKVLMLGELGDDAARGYVYGLAPTGIATGLPMKPRPNEIEVNRAVQLPVTEHVQCCVGGAVGNATLEGYFELFLREWGLKELVFVGTRVVVQGGSALDIQIRKLGLRALHGSSYALDNELGFEVELETEHARDRIALVLQRIRIDARKRPRRDPVHQLVTRTSTRSDANLPVATVCTFEPAIASDSASLEALLRDSPDPFVAAHAAYLAGDQRIESMLPGLVACALDPDEDHTVRMNAIWALAQLGDGPTLRQLATGTPGADLQAQAQTAWAMVDPRGLVDAAETHPALTAFVAERPLLRYAELVSRERTTLATTSTPRSIAVDARRVVVGGWQCVYAAAHGEPLAEVAACEGGADSVAVVGERIAVADAGGVLVIGGKRTHRIAIEPSPDASIALSPDGATLAAGFATITVWNAATRAKVATLKAEHTRVKWDGAGRLYALGRERLARYSAPFKRSTTVVTGEWNSLGVALDGTFALGRTDGTVGLWRGGEAITLPRAHTAAVSSIAFTADGQRFASGDHGGTIVVWDVGEARPLRLLSAPGTRIYGVAFADGALYSVSVDEDQLSRWDLG